MVIRVDICEDKGQVLSCKARLHNDDFDKTGNSMGMTGMSRAQLKKLKRVFESCLDTIEQPCSPGTPRKHSPSLVLKVSKSCRKWLIVFRLASSSWTMAAAAQHQIMQVLLYSLLAVLILNTCFPALQFCLLKVQCLLQLGYFEGQGSFLSLHKAQLCLQGFFSAVFNRQAYARSKVRMSAGVCQQLAFFTHAVSVYLPLSLVPVGAAVVSLDHLGPAGALSNP